MYIQFIFFVIFVRLRVCLRGVWMEQSTNAARVRSLIPIGSDDANDACTRRMMNAMELKRRARVRWQTLNS